LLSCSPQLPSSLTDPLPLHTRLYFPPVPEDEDSSPSHDGETAADGDEARSATRAKLDAEAAAVASELPSAPTSDPSGPSDPGHAGKKQKQREE
jgi:hypothetical protein